MNRQRVFRHSDEEAAVQQLISGAAFLEPPSHRLYGLNFPAYRPPSFGA